MLIILAYTTISCIVSLIIVKLLLLVDIAWWVSIVHHVHVLSILHGLALVSKLVLWRWVALRSRLEISWVIVYIHFFTRTTFN